MAQNITKQSLLIVTYCYCNLTSPTQFLQCTKAHCGLSGSASTTWPSASAWHHGLAELEKKAPGQTAASSDFTVLFASVSCSSKDKITRLLSYKIRTNRCFKQLKIQLSSLLVLRPHITAFSPGIRNVPMETVFSWPPPASILKIPR